MTVVARWRALDRQHRILLIRAVLGVSAAALKVRLVPFSRIAAGLGPMQSPRPDAARDTASATELATARRIGWAVDAAARHLPFEAACLARALAAHALCRAHGLAPTLRMGAERNQQGRAETHAWLTAAGVGVTGFPLPPAMVEVGCFSG